MTYENQAWNILMKHPGSYELKDMIAGHADQAIKNKDINLLLQPITTFNPDLSGDGLTQYTAQEVETYTKNTGIYQFVQEHINT